MLQSLAALKKVVSAKRHPAESFVFFLHYRFTFLFLMVSSVVLATKQFAGDRIACHSTTSTDVSTPLLEHYCWATATYSVTSAYSKQVGVDVPHPGVSASEDSTEYEYRDYYQYVHLTLFIQAVLFYLPHLVWKSLEGNRMKRLQEFIDDSISQQKKEMAEEEKKKAEEEAKAAKKMVEEEEQLKKRKDSDDEDDKSQAYHDDEKVKSQAYHDDEDDEEGHLDDEEGHLEDEEGHRDDEEAKSGAVYDYEDVAVYMAERWNRSTSYALRYVTCEVLAIANLAFQSLLLDAFFNGHFLSLGLDLMGHANRIRDQDPVRLFPIVTNCFFRKMGAAGRIDVVDANCVLPLNALNVKIYMFLWVWFATLLAMSVVSVLHQLLCAVFRRYRVASDLLLNVLFGCGERESREFRDLVQVHAGFGDWFVLRCVKGKLDRPSFEILVKLILRRLRRKRGFGCENVNKALTSEKEEATP